MGADDDVFVPSGCYHCGRPERTHYQGGPSTVGAHDFEPPSLSQIRNRMVARRATVMASRPIGDKRPVPPPLEARAPDCSICGQETDYGDESFECEDCGVSWPSYGLSYTNGEWNESDADQCEEVVQPWLDNTWTTDLVRKATAVRCLLDADHVRHKIPHTNPEMTAFVKGWR